MKRCSFVRGLVVWAGLGMGVGTGVLGGVGGEWGMVDEMGTVRIPEKFDEVGEFRGNLARSLSLPEFLPGIKGAKILRWLKPEGSEVIKGEPLAEAELTDPALPVVIEISGMLSKIGVPAGGAAIPGSPLGSIRVMGHVGMFDKKQHDIVCPGYGPNPGSATVVRWLKEEGDSVVKGEKVAEIRPEHAMAMVEGPGSGTLVKIEVAAGADAKVGQSIARMGLGRVPVQLGKEWFTVDERGARVTQNHFEEVGSMQGGMAPVLLGGKWGFANEEGKIIGKVEEGSDFKKKAGKNTPLFTIEPETEYEAARKVQGGLAAVKLKGQWGYVAYQEGGLKMAIAPRFLQSRDFAEGLAAVEESDDAPVTEENETSEEVVNDAQKIAAPPAWGYIIPSGKLWIKLDFAEAGDFKEGRAAVRPIGEGMGWILIDSKGKMRTTGKYRRLVLLGGRKVAWQKEGESWGLMDFQEKVVEVGGKEGSWEAIGMFAEKRAPAKDKSGRWGYIDLEGNWVVPPKFERAGVFHSGLAAAKEPGGKWGYVKPDGSWGLEPRFTRARSFTDGLAAISEKGAVEAGPEPETGGVWE